MLKVDFTTQFKRDYKLAEKRGWDMSLLENVIRDLISGLSLPEKNKDHALLGNYKGYRECHIKPDWLLVYQVGNGVIVFNRTGSHSDLF